MKDIDAQPLGAIAKVDCGFRLEGRALGMVDGVVVVQIPGAKFSIGPVSLIAEMAGDRHFEVGCTNERLAVGVLETKVKK